MGNNLQPGQFQQLPMFMTVGELKQVRPNDFVSGAVVNSVGMPRQSYLDRRWGEKLETTKNRAGRPESLYDKVNREGVRDPIDIAHGEMVGGGSAIWDGHHRLAVVMDTKPDDHLVPVVHQDRGNYHDINPHESLRSNPPNDQ